MLKSGLNNCWATPIYKTSISDEQCQELIQQVMMYQNIDKPQSDFDSTSLTDSIPLLKELAYENTFKEPVADSYIEEDNKKFA